MKFIILSIFILVGCQSFDGREKVAQPQPDYGDTPPDLVEAYEKGIQFLDREDYKKAAKHFEGLLTKYPTSYLATAMMFNAGSAYEGMGKCKTAGRNFRSIVRTANKENPRIQSRALVRLSYAYECLNADKKVVTSLIDAKNREQYLFPVTVKAEIPARLGGAYGRLGKPELSQKLFKQADQGLYQLRDKSLPPAKQRDELARAMFFMGRYWFKGFHIKNHENVLKTFEQSQKYLIKSVELDSPKWSPSSARNLVNVYHFFWKYLQAIHKTPQVGKYKVSRDQVNSFAILTLQSLKTLKSMKFPEKNPPKIVRSMMQRLDGIEKDYTTFLTKNNLGFSVTETERKRQSLKREGRTHNPDPKLERMMKNMKRKKSVPLGPSN